MKKLLIALSLFLFCFSAKAQVDSTKLHILDTHLDKYVDGMLFETTAVKEKECDFLIESVTDTLLRSHIANHLYSHYRKSRLMGDEGVALYLWDKWFKDGPLKTTAENGGNDQEEFYDRMLFADFNRSTMIGEQAPELLARNKHGWKIAMPRGGFPSILYFYDTECAKCKLESVLLPVVLKDCKKKVYLFAFYTGSNKKAWRKWRCSFKVKNRNVKIVHLWDPEVDTDYLRLYGVTSTPKLYVTTAEGKIIGRRLEVENLQEILDLL